MTLSATINETQRCWVGAAIANLDHGQRADQASARAANLPVSQTAAATMLNVGERSIRRAVAVRDNTNATADLKHEVEQGRIPISVAVRAADTGTVAPQSH